MTKEIYSLTGKNTPEADTGSLLFRAQKPTGEAVYPITYLPKAVLLVGSSTG
jgi:hypothetical protein